MQNIPLFNMPIPSWLVDYVKYKSLESPIPLAQLLKDSLFYPACGFDAAPIKHLTGAFYSFVYADYGVTESELTSRLAERGFKDYEIVLNRPLNIERELHPALSKPFDRSKIKSGIVETVTPYARWLILKSIHSEKLFSLLYLGIDGVDCYRYLYVEQGISAKALAIIRPGTGWGNNWTDFKHCQAPLADVVIQSGLDAPDFLICQGTADNLEQASCWPDWYQEPLFFCRTFKKDGLVVYKRSVRENKV